jgi:hypothetical protein
MITAGEAAAFLAGSRRLRYRTVQTSGRSCRFGKGQVRIGDRVESMPKFRHRACRCRLRSGPGAADRRQFASVAPAGILFMISRAHPGPALWEIRYQLVASFGGSWSALIEWYGNDRGAAHYLPTCRHDLCRSGRLLDMTQASGIAARCAGMKSNQRPAATEDQI